MCILLLLLVMFVIISICIQLIPSIYNLFMIVRTEIFFRNKNMDTKPCINHQIRVLTLEDNTFQDETLYVLKKGIYFLFILSIY